MQLQPFFPVCTSQCGSVAKNSWSVLRAFCVPRHSSLTRHSFSDGEILGLMEGHLQWEQCVGLVAGRRLKVFASPDCGLKAVWDINFTIDIVEVCLHRTLADTELFSNLWVPDSGNSHSQYFHLSECKR